MHIICGLYSPQKRDEREEVIELVYIIYWISLLFVSGTAQVKGLSIEHEKLAVAQRHAAENNNSPTEAGSSNSSSASAGSNNNNSSTAAAAQATAAAAEAAEAPENGLARGIKRRTPTPAPPSPAPTYSLPNVYSAAHYYDSPQKRLMRWECLRSFFFQPFYYPLLFMPPPPLLLLRGYTVMRTRLSPLSIGYIAWHARLYNVLLCVLYICGLQFSDSREAPRGGYNGMVLSGEIDLWGILQNANSPRLIIL